MCHMKRISHFEIQAENPEKIVEFYTSCFGWDIKKWEGGQMEYWIVMTGKQDEAGGINGGLLRRHGPRPEPMQSVNAFVCTITVDDFDGIAKKILDNGGIVALPKMALVGMAWQGYFKDPDGNIFGIHQADPNAK